ncbi:MAG: glycoside hydrolase family 5 protein, partial [Planctomycetota bacterium]
ARPVESLVYELLNEPMAPDAADWNRVYRPVFDKLRAAEPERWLKLGCNWYQTPETMGQLAVPEDPRTILGFHFYAPHCLTHFQAAWSQGTPGYAGPVQYPGQIIPADQAEALDAQARADLAGRGALENWDADRLATQLAEPLAVRDRTGLALHCGELGCLATVPAASRLRWYTDVLDMLDARDIGWCIWNYKSTAKFGLVDDSGQPTDLGCMIRQRLATRD